MTATVTDKQLLDIYVNIAEFMSLCFSGDVEVVVHDVADLDKSVIAIFNSYVSGRTKGAPMTDKGLHFIEDGIYKKQRWVANYPGMTDQGVQVRSSTFFIKNAKGELIGALCVNADTRKYEILRQLAESMISRADQSESMEVLKTSLEPPINRVLTGHCTSSGRLVDEFTMSDRLGVISELLEAGYFERKGAISELAEKLRISEPTVYRYLKILKKGLDYA